MAILGLLNAYVIFVLGRHADWKRDVEKRIMEMEKCSFTEDRFRKIIQEELQSFELRVIREGRIDS
jgi:hypothetical protein